MKPTARPHTFLCIASSALLFISCGHAATAPGILEDPIFNITTANGAETITLNANQPAKSLTLKNALSNS